MRETMDLKSLLLKRIDTRRFWRPFAEAPLKWKKTKASDLNVKSEMFGQEVEEELECVGESSKGFRFDLEVERKEAKEEDGTRLRAILELVADYKLKIKLPGDLIAKLLFQRENSTPLVRCSVEHGTTSSSNPQPDSPNPAAQLSSNGYY
ncbi:unnamed protein product [Microthlaspi erraticum]|uniref:Uncharacterized protein n=1 Tax=Microthlaspi erraticum TaxID=1685480 RepID=A0A6D2J764_9BRAS|nr:unnamed protein product [Microthlaspi erraticum]CAA7035616.1 unnamed protein product [Microthlaspi erraticum]